MHVVQSWHILPRVTVESAWNLSTLGYVEQWLIRSSVSKSINHLDQKWINLSKLSNLSGVDFRMLCMSVKFVDRIKVAGKVCAGRSEILERKKSAGYLRKKKLEWDLLLQSARLWLVQLINWEHINWGWIKFRILVSYLSLTRTQLNLSKHPSVTALVSGQVQIKFTQMRPSGGILPLADHNNSGCYYIDVAVSKRVVAVMYKNIIPAELVLMLLQYSVKIWKSDFNFGHLEGWTERGMYRGRLLEGSGGLRIHFLRRN